MRHCGYNYSLAYSAILEYTSRCGKGKIVHNSSLTQAWTNNLAMIARTIRKGRLAAFLVDCIPGSHTTQPHWMYYITSAVDARGAAILYQKHDHSILWGRAGHDLTSISRILFINGHGMTNISVVSLLLFLSPYKHCHHWPNQSKFACSGHERSGQTHTS